MKLLTTAAAVLVLAGCATPNADEGRRQRNLNYGLFYDVFRPESSKQAEARSKIDRPIGPQIDESYDVSKIRAPRQYSEVAEDYELGDWRDGVLVRADADLLKKMRDDTAGKVQALEQKHAALAKEPRTITVGVIEPVKRQLDTEKKKLDAIDARMREID